MNSLGAALCVRLSVTDQHFIISANTSVYNFFITLSGRELLFCLPLHRMCAVFPLCYKLVTVK